MQRGMDSHARSLRQTGVLLNIVGQIIVYYILVISRNLGMDTARGRQYSSGWERVVGGLIVLGVAVVSERFLPIPFWLTLTGGILFGLLPAVGGVRRLIRDASELRQDKRLALEERLSRDQANRDNLEKTILKIAQERHGVVTPALVVLGSNLKLEEAEKALGDMAARGYAEMRVKDNGTIDYVFHDLL
jgi:hypothetical protein